VGGVASDTGLATVMALWRAFVASRDTRLRDELIELYRPLAKRIAARMFVLRRDNSVAFADYFQYACVGLVEAIDRYEPERPVLFETFATYRVRGAILNGLAKESELAAQRHYWAARAQDRVESLKRPVTDDGAPANALTDLVELTVSLAFGVLLESRAEPADESPSANPYAAAELGELVRRLRRAVEQLPERERSIIELHYYQHEAFQDIAARFGVTKGRVSQLHARALTRMRAAFEAEQARANVTI
jgi:RNA polymerase sigma factor for flagellar operon FliA